MAGILDKVKSALGITGSYQDETLKVYMDEVIGYVVDAGVPEAVANSDMSAGVISRGVSDLWNYGSAGGKLSEYFYQRVTQLVYAIRAGKIITFAKGDYGIFYPVSIEGVTIAEGDVVTFKCGDLEKNYTDFGENSVLISFTQAESEALDVGTYRWTLKVAKGAAVITPVKDGVLIVT